MPFRLSIAIAAMLLSVAARATQPRIVFAPARALTAGEVVTVGWDQLPADVDELEFLLAIPDGEVVRLTPQLVPSNGSFGWTVPNLPSDAAVLELRAGIEGREVVLASSAPFVIRGIPGRARLDFHDGEWWTLAAETRSVDPPAMRSISRTIAARMFVRSRSGLPAAGIDLRQTHRLDVNEVTSRRVETHRGAPLVVPQRK